MVEVREILKGVDNPSLDLVAKTLDEQVTFLAIDKLNWSTDGYKPNARVGLAYNDTELFVRFLVIEESIKAIYTENNSKVSKDSCCELFISPDSNDCYYNFEFSCIGTLLMGYRKMGEAATRPVSEIMEQVRRMSSLGNKPFDLKDGRFEWGLTIAIPFEAFFAHKIETLKGCSLTANLYKCGDELTKPHYLSLFPINTDKPAFHRPDYFGALTFL